MYPVLLHVGPILIYSYSALVDIGLVVGFTLALIGAGRRCMDRILVVDASLAAAILGLMLGRAMYVGLHWPYYKEHLAHALSLREGGLTWQGAAIGGIAGAVILCVGRKKRPLVTLDVLAPGAAVVAISGWLACFMAGCAHGVEAFPGQGILWTLSADMPNLYGIREPRVAVQLLGATWGTIVLATILLARRGTLRNGMAIALWLTLQSLGAWGLGFLRGDDMPLIAGFRVDQMVNLALAVAGSAALLLFGLDTRRSSGSSDRTSTRR